MSNIAIEENKLLYNNILRNLEKRNKMNKFYSW